MAKLGNVCEIAAGQGAPQGENSYCNCNEGIPFIKAGDLSDLLSGKLETEIQCVNEIVAKQHKLKLYPAGSILFAKSGMSCMKGYVYRTKNPCYIVSHLAIVIPQGIDGEYLKYYFQHNKPNALIKDSAYPSISLQDISNIELTVPSLDIQASIASELNKVNMLISFRKQQLSKLDELVKSRFVELFGDPVSNPMRWKKEQLQCNATLLNGRAYKQDELLDSGKYPVLRVGNFFSNRSWYYSDLELDDDKYCDNGDLLYAWSASFGPRIWSGGKVIYHYHIWKVLVGENYNKQFLYNLLDYVTASLMGETHGIGMMHLTKSGMEETEFIVPPIDSQNQFAAFVKQTDKSKFEIQKSLEKLETLKKALMQKYFG